MTIFISYSSKDKKSAEAICAAIENRGFRCWISSRDVGPGQNFQTQIVSAIRAAQVMVLVFSDNANNSEEIKKEIVLAGQSRLVVIPLRVEDVTPGDAFAYEFATRQWIDVFGDWENAIQRLIQQIEMVVTSDPPPARPATAEEEKPIGGRAAPPAAATVGAQAGPGPPRRGYLLISAGCVIAVVLAAAGWLVFQNHAEPSGNAVSSSVNSPPAGSPAGPAAGNPVSSAASPVSSTKITPLDDAFSKGVGEIKGQH
jgi:hypothetical protein